MLFGKTKKGQFYRKDGISSSLPPTNTMGIPMLEPLSNNPLDFAQNQRKKLENQRIQDMKNKMEEDKLKEELEENKTDLERISEMLEASPVQETIQSSETSPQDVNLTDVPSSDRISEEENKKVSTLQHNENLVELSSKLIDKFGENAAQAVETLEEDQSKKETAEKKEEQDIKKGKKEDVKKDEKEVEEDQKQIDKDKKVVKQELKAEKKAEDKAQEVVEKSVADLINKSSSVSVSGKGSGRHKFTEADKKQFQSESFREALLDIEGGADALADAKAQGLF
jgi:hypothetical protein